MWVTCKTCGDRDMYSSNKDICNKCGVVLSEENLARRGSIYSESYKKKHKKKVGFFEQDENGKAPFMELFYTIILVMFFISIFISILF